VLASKLGVAAVDLLVNGQGDQAVGLKNNKIIYKDLAAVNEEIVDKPDLYRLLDMLLY
jgi:6-phosphofructokinase 1